MNFKSYISKLKIIFVFILFVPLFTYGQDKINSSKYENLIVEVFLSIRSDDYLKAHTKNEELRRIALREKDTFLLAKSYNLEGVLCGATGNYEKSEMNFSKAISLFGKINNKQQKLVSQGNLYTALRYQNKVEDNYELMQEVANQLEKINAIDYFRIKFDLIKYLREDEEYEMLLENTQKWLSKFEEFDFSKEEALRVRDITDNTKARCLYLKAFALIETRKYEEGYELLNSFEVKKYLFRTTKTDQLVKEKEISEYYYFKSKYFLESKKKSDSLRICLELHEKHNNLFYTNFQNKFRVKLFDLSKTKEVNLEKAKNEELKNKNQIIIFISTVFILLLLVLLFFLYRAYLLIKSSSEKLKTQNIELLENDNERNRFFSVLTHELRTPIYSVKGLIQLISEEFNLGNITYKNLKTKTYYSSLNTLGEHLYALTNNILLYTKFNLGETNLKKNEIILSDFVNKTIQPFRIQNKIIVQIEDDVTDHVVVDQIKLRQVLINLVSNAIKYAEGKPIHIQIKSIEDSDTKCKLRFSVIDQGKGISKDRFEYLFNAFNEGDVNLDEGVGTGLGLFIVSNILKLYNSKIVLNSELNKGSNFSFDLELDKHLNKEKTIVHSIEGLRILVVDDNIINLMITQKTLQKSNAICDTESNGLDAIKRVQKSHYDVLLIDVHMPHIDGIETTKRIRKFNTEIPIIALTAVDFETNYDVIIKSGMDDVVSKPFNNNYLFEKIHALTSLEKV